jgi:hypothetical protein
VIPNRDDLLQLPEDAFGVAVVVIAQGDVFHMRLAGFLGKE